MGFFSKLGGLLLGLSGSNVIAISKDAASSTRLNYAHALDSAGKTSEAVAIYWDMLEKDVSEVGAAQNLSDILIRECQYGDAVAILAVILDKCPNFSPLWCNFSAALSAIGQHERAFTSADRAVQLDAGNPMAYYNRGKCHWHYVRNQLAIADYEKAVILDPSNLEIANQLHLSKFAISDAVHDFGPVKHEMRAHGAFIADGKEIASTLMCPHCGCHFPSLRQAKEKCLNCGDYTCDKADCIASCNPYQRQLDEAASISAHAVSG